MPQSQLQLFTQRKFLPLFLTQLTVYFNNYAFKNALGVLIAYRLASLEKYDAGVMSSVVALVFILPIVLFSATAGKFADKFSRAKQIIILKAAEIVIILLAILGFYLQSTYLLLFVMFLIGLKSASFTSLKLMTVRDLLSEDELIAGNGLIEGSGLIAILIGSVLGGVLILGPVSMWVFSGILLTFAILGLVSSLFIPHVPVINPQLKISPNFLFESFRTIKIATARKEIFITILGIAWFNTMGSIFLAQLAVLTKNSLQANQNVEAFFFGLASVGIALGAIITNTVLKGKDLIKYIPFFSLAISFFLFDLYFACSPVFFKPTDTLTGLIQFLTSISGWHVIIGVLLFTISSGIYDVALNTFLQQSSSKEKLASYIACMSFMNAFGALIGAVVTIKLISIGFTIPQILLVISIINILFYIWFWRLRNMQT